MKSKVILLAALSLASALFANSPREKLPPHNPLEFKAGYFFFLSSMNKVYKDGGLDLQLSTTWRVAPWLRVYGSVEYLEKSGQSLNGNERTSIWEIPISAGLQPIVLFSSKPEIWLYCTGGPRYVFARVHNRSPYVSKYMRSNDIGAFANVGVLYKIARHFTLNFFGEYSYARLSFTSSVANSFGKTVQAGGLTFGGGLGYAF
jgi:hypothetical protein